MKKRSIITAFLILGALAAIIFSFAIPEDNGNAIVKPQYITQNIITPILEDLSAEELLSRKENICNIDIVVENFAKTKLDHAGVSSYSIVFVNSEGHQAQFAQSNIKYFQGGIRIASARQRFIAYYSGYRRENFLILRSKHGD